MYVKVLTLRENRAARIYTADPSQPVEFGRERLETDPSQMTYEELTAALKTGSDSMDRTQVGEDATGFYDHGQTGGAFWEVGWVKFYKPGSIQVHMVAATTPIYLLDESGKTIDRV